MKTIGVLGGMSAVATGEYYRRLNDGINAVRGGHAAADVVIYSVDFAVIEGCIRTGAWDRAAEHLADRARRLERAGAEFLLLATNTMHRVAEQIEAAVDIPFVHIVDVTADAALADGARTVGLLGTAPVMAPGFYWDRFTRHGLDVLVPAAADQVLVDAAIFSELTRGCSPSPPGGSTSGSSPTSSPVGRRGSCWAAPRSACSSPPLTFRAPSCTTPLPCTSTGPSNSASLPDRRLMNVGDPAVLADLHDSTPASPTS